MKHSKVLEKGTAASIEIQIFIQMSQNKFYWRRRQLIANIANILEYALKYLELFSIAKKKLNVRIGGLRENEIAKLRNIFIFISRTSREYIRTGKLNFPIS